MSFNSNKHGGGGRSFSASNPNQHHNKKGGHFNNNSTNTNGFKQNGVAAASNQQQQQHKPKRGDFFNDRAAEIAKIEAKQHASDHHKHQHHHKHASDAHADAGAGHSSEVVAEQQTAAEKAKEIEHAKNILLNAAAGNAVNSSGALGQLITRRVQYMKYRKAHTIEYPANAIVLNPKHVQKLANKLKGTKDGKGDEGEEAGKGKAEAEEDNPSSPTNTAHSFVKSNRKSHQEDCTDDPRARELPEILCTEEVFHRNLQLTWRSVGAGCGAGLVNCGNTCFANAVLQCFAFTTPFAQFLMNNFSKPNTGPDVPFDYAFALAETLRLIHNNKGKAIKPGLIIGNLKGIWKGLILGKQCDSFEFGQQLITKVQESVLRRLVGTRKVPFTVQHTTPFMRVAGGFERSQVSWSKEDEIQQLKKANNKAAAADLAMDKSLVGDKLVSNTYEHFTMMTLAVVGGNTLDQLLADYYKREKLGRVYSTSRKVTVMAFRQISLHIPPPSLMIHMKRFDNNRNKINKGIQFPKTLDMRPYCSPNADVKEALYDLCAVTVHIGGAINYGHYIAFVKGKNGLWYMCDDESVRQVGEAEVLRSQALIVYYSMRESSFKKLTTPTPLLMGKKEDSSMAMPDPLSIPSASFGATPAREDSGVEMSEEDIRKAMRAAREKMLKEAADKERQEMSSESDDEDEEGSSSGEEDDSADDEEATPQPKGKSSPAAAPSAVSGRVSTPIVSGADGKQSAKITTSTSSSSSASLLIAKAAKASSAAKIDTAKVEAIASVQPITKKAASALRDKVVSNVYNNNSDEDEDNYEDARDDDEDEDGSDNASSSEEGEDAEEGTSSDEDDEPAAPAVGGKKRVLEQPSKVSPKFAPIISTLVANTSAGKSPKQTTASSFTSSADGDAPVIAPLALPPTAKTITVSKGPLPKGLSKFAGLMGVIKNQQLISKAEQEEEAAFLARTEGQQKKEVKETIRVNVFAPKTVVKSGEEVRKLRIRRAGDDDEKDSTPFSHELDDKSNNDDKTRNSRKEAEKPVEEEEEPVQTVPFSREAYSKAITGEGETGGKLNIERKRHEGLFKKNLRDEEWAREFDKGRVKKVRSEKRARDEEKFCKANVFQVAQNQKARGEFVPKYRPTEEEKRAQRMEARRGGFGGGGGFESQNRSYGSNNEQTRRISFD